jgi:hypothetical protein
MITVLHVPFGTENFFENHSLLFLIFISFFPRLTLLFSSVVSGGLFWWLGWLFFPRILVATLATFAYFQTNPILVTISWLIALSGESFEKQQLSRKRVVVKTFRGVNQSSQNQTTEGNTSAPDAIDVTYKKLD